MSVESRTVSNECVNHLRKALIRSGPNRRDVVHPRSVNIRSALAEDAHNMRVTVRRRHEAQGHGVVAQTQNRILVLIREVEECVDVVPGVQPGSQLGDCPSRR